jgi:choline dehydrogenase-like flavoprotein
LPPVCTTEEDIFFFLQALDETLGRYYQAEGPALGLGKTVAKALAEKANERLGNDTVDRVLRGNRKNGGARALPTVNAAEGKGGNGKLPSSKGGNGASRHDLDAFGLESFKEFGDYGGGLVEKCDFLVIGGGPAGIIAAKRLAEAGRDVLVVEAGRRLTEDDFGYDLMNTTARYFWDAGVKPTRGNTFMASLRAKALGGGSVFNSAICMRASRWALESWAENHGVEGLLEDDLAPYFDRVESFLGVGQSEAMMAKRNTLVRDGCRSLGWRVEPLPRMTPGCIGSSECITGCRTGGKASVDRRGAPEVLRAGGRIYTGVQIDKLTIRDGRVLGAEGHTVDPVSGKKVDSVRILARCTVLAAGVYASPAIAQRSGLTRSVIGSNLRMHPSTNMLGLFDEPIVPWEGATQGYACLEFIDQGTKIEDLWATPGIFALRLPSLGEEFATAFEQLSHMGIIAGWVGGEDSVGRVKAYPGYVDATYDLGEGDVRRLQQCTVAQAEILLAAGAKEVFLRFGPGVPKIRSVEELYRKVRDVTATVGHFSGASNHVFGTMPMGGKMEDSATDSFGKVWDADNLYVCDTSLFPHSSGSNPMLPAMAMADRQAEELLKRY